MPEGQVETEQGRVAGVRDGRAWAWRGILYARPPVGTLRFRPPEPAIPWTGVRDASQFGPAAAQRMPWLGGGRRRLGPSLSEDCLTLNVWSPAADGRLRAVMVWVHGGGFLGGSGALYHGGSLAAAGDIVVVTINYRLGVFGFVNFADLLGEPDSGSNLGLRDVMAALHWVRTNIAGFGGDPARVTLAGESAGSIITSLMMVTDAAAPLFDQAIMQSGSFNLVHSRERSRSIAQSFRDQLGAGAADLASLQGLSTEALQNAEAAVSRHLRGTAPAVPWWDGDLLPASFEAACGKLTPRKPLLAGANRDEIMLFRVMPGPKILRSTRPTLFDQIRRDLPPEAVDAVEQAYPATAPGTLALGSDANFVMPTMHFAERHAGGGAPTWVYRFDYAHPWLRACHALELFFLWPFPGLLGAALRGGFLTGLRSGLSERMRAAWASFVRTGHPGEDWPAFTLPRRATRLFALQDRLVDDPMRERRQAWQGRDMQPGR